jgi:hypothetical protein
MKNTRMLIGLAALPLVVLGCKPKTTAETTTTKAASTQAASTGAATPTPTTAPATDRPFEGEIQLAVTQQGSTTSRTIDYLIKGDKVRSQPAGADASAARVIGDRKEKTAYAIVDATKSYSTIDVDSKSASPTVTKSSKVDNVLGEACDDWTITNGGDRYEVCVAKNIAYVDPIGGVAGEPAWASILTREHVFPLRVVATDRAGKQQFRAEATKIERRQLDDGLFHVPANYQIASRTKTMTIASIP